jgi:hypothetical protein
MSDLLPFVSGLPLFSIALGLFFFLYWTSAFFVVYHLTRFGIGPVPKLFALVFLLGSMLLFSMTMLAYARVDFSALGGSLRDGLHLPGVPGFKLPSFNNTFPTVPPIGTP